MIVTYQKQVEIIGHRDLEEFHNVGPASRDGSLSTLHAHHPHPGLKITRTLYTDPAASCFFYFSHLPISVSPYSRQHT
jgi:hypothetical protein